MSRRLEAAWDDRGLALGVQVFAASEFQVDPFYLLALLNSKLLSYLFRTASPPSDSPAAIWRSTRGNSPGCRLR